MRVVKFFDWAPERRQNSSMNTNKHLPQILRLRDKLITSLSLHLDDYVIQINKKIDSLILNLLNYLIPDLDALLRDEALLRYIAGEEPEIEDNPVSPILSRIASISLPDIYS